MMVRWLSPDDEEALVEFLLIAPKINLFLLGMVDQAGLGLHWAAVLDGERVVAAAMGFGSLVVPAAGPVEQGRALGDLLHQRVEPELMVGPRALCDSLLPSLTDKPPTLHIDQRLYIATPGTIRADSRTAIELASPNDLEELVELGLAMNQEDLGRSPDNLEAHRRAVRNRIEQNRVYISRDAGRIVFTVNVGTQHSFGCQLGGTYVLPERRGLGFATRGMRALLPSLCATYPLVTLHVRESNPSAIALYERVGFLRDAPYRLVTW